MLMVTDAIAAVDEGVPRQELGETYQKSEAEQIATVFVEILRLAVACEWAIEDKRVVSEAIGKALEPHIESLGLTSGKPGE